MAYIGYYAGQDFPVAQNAGASAGPYRRFPLAPRACGCPNAMVTAAGKRAARSAPQPKLAYYSGDSFPIRETPSAGPYKMFFTPTRGGGCQMGYYRPSQAIARFITPGQQLSGLGQTEIDFSDPTTLAVIGLGAVAILYTMFKAGKGARRAAHAVARG